MNKDNDFDVSSAKVLNHEILPGKVLLEPVSILAKKPVSDWKEQDVMPLVRILAGRIGIDGSGENRQGANALGRIGDDLTTFISSYPKIQSIIDPVYVSIDLTTCPNNAPPAINGYPPASSPHIALVPYSGSNHVFSFTGPGAADSAQHLVGWLQGTYVGLRAFIYHTGVPAIYY